MHFLKIGKYLAHMSLRHLLRRDHEVYGNSFVEIEKLPGQRRDITRRKVLSFSPLPNVSEYLLFFRGYDWLFSLFRIKRPYPRRIKAVSWLNSSSNRYVEYMMRRIRKGAMLKSPKVYRDIWILMNSTAFQVMAYNHVARGWYKSIPMEMVQQHLKELNKLCRSKATNLQYHRTYIPKGDTWRPLGVPTLPWRVYLHMMNAIITAVRLDSETDVQHGFLPGRGALTAWKRLFNLLRKKWVFELDYTKFFDKISLESISRHIVDIGLTERFSKELLEINLTPIELKDEFKLEEYNWYYKTEHKRLSRKFNSKVQLAYMMYYVFRSIVEGTYSTGSPTALSNSYTASQLAFYGVPQGAPTSCSLATLPLRDIERAAASQGIDLVLYADDLVAASDKEFDPSLLEDPEKGISINWSKSRWVKKDGVWEPWEDMKRSGIKFLGLIYHPPEWKKTGVRSWIQTLPPIYAGHTRNGSRLETSSRISFLAYLAKSRELMLGGSASQKKRYASEEISLWEWLKKNHSKWLYLRDNKKSITKSPIYGWVIACLYKGSWEYPDEKISKLQASRKSWVARCYSSYRQNFSGPGINIFNASSYATHDLALWLRERKQRWRKACRRATKSRSPRH